MKEYTLLEENGHTVYYSEYGNPNGVPIISFHGGPGSKSKESHAQRFDLEKYRVILFDQRGCGKSTPHGEITHNTTVEILSDTERIREALNIDSWFVAGASWGATCALLYAIQNPNRTKGLLLASVFMAHERAQEWLFGTTGAATFMPDVWEKRMEFFEKYNISLDTQNVDLFKALESAEGEEKKEIVAGIINWEGNLFGFGDRRRYVSKEDIDENDIAETRIFMHYVANNSFTEKNYILEHISNIADIPTVIVEGRCDIITPPIFVHELVKQLNDCKLIYAESSGHMFTAEGDAVRTLAFDQFLTAQI